MHEWVITSGTLAMGLLIITLLVRILPVIPIQRTAEEQDLLNTDKK
jgi:molybdopterin-containing oxidoreductase family membrane subunit